MLVDQSACQSAHQVTVYRVSFLRDSEDASGPSDSNLVMVLRGRAMALAREGPGAAADRDQGAA